MKNTAKIKIEDIKKIGIYINTNKKTMYQIKQETGCDYIINGSLYDTVKFEQNKSTSEVVEGTFVVDNQELKYQSGVYGFRFDNGVPQFAYYDNKYHKDKCEYFITTKPTLVRNGVATGETGNLDNSDRGRSAIGITKDNEFVMCCISDTIDRDDYTFAELSKEMIELGCDVAVNLDGGGSAQCNFLNVGEVCYSGRIVHNFICVWLKDDKKEIEPMKYKVAIDVGHIANTPNKSPDGRYNEHTAMTDIANRMKLLLDKYPEIEAKVFDNPDLTDTEDLVKIVSEINTWGADIAISLHTNSSASSTWDIANGWEAYIYSHSSVAETLANAIYEQSIPFLGLADRRIKTSTTLYFLKQTAMPAVLIEHGFHNNYSDVEKLLTSEFRQNCAIANVKGILNFYGINWIEEPIIPPTDEHWAKQHLDSLVEKGVISNADAWSDFNASLSTKTIGELLALIDKGGN